MGGPGSSRWTSHSRRLTVEECKPLDIDRLRRHKQLYAPAPGTSLQGALRWYYSDDVTQETGSVGYRVEHLGSGLVCRLLYRVEGVEVDLPIPIQQVSAPLGGHRWHWTCPLVVEGTPLQSAGPQALPATRWALLRLPALLRPDLYQLPGEPPVGRALRPPRGQPGHGFPYRRAHTEG